MLQQMVLPLKQHKSKPTPEMNSSIWKGTYGAHLPLHHPPALTWDLQGCPRQEHKYTYQD